MKISEQLRRCALTATTMSRVVTDKALREELVGLAASWQSRSEAHSAIESEGSGDLTEADALSAKSVTVKVAPLTAMASALPDKHPARSFKAAENVARHPRPTRIEARTK